MKLEGNNSNGLMSGTINLADPTSLTGSFDYFDTTTSNVVGVKGNIAIFIRSISRKISWSQVGIVCFLKHVN